MRTLYLATALILAAAAPALAQTSPAMEEYKAAMTKMHASSPMMSIGDADIDFVRMMIPHHQAAIDMAKTQLKYGKDPAIRKLAQDIIVAQEKEITEMNVWLKKNGK